MQQPTFKRNHGLLFKDIKDMDEDICPITSKAKEMPRKMESSRGTKF